MLSWVYTVYTIYLFIFGMAKNKQAYFKNKIVKVRQERFQINKINK